MNTNLFSMTALAGRRHLQRSARILCCTFGIAGGLLLANANAVPVTEEVAKENLAKVPATDPKPTAIPAVVPAMRGQHPRLLFTKDEIAALKKQVATDPILKKTYEDVAGPAKKFTLAKAYNPKNILTDDTSAITMLKSWPGLAYAYALDRDPAVKQGIIDILTMMLEEPYWSNTAEFESNMGMAENMMMVGVLFDAVYNDLDPAFRSKMAAKILTETRRLFYLGHKQLCTMPIKYWQQDPANNHRWHRDAGFAACMLAIADEKGLDTGYMLEQLKQELDLVTKWYPPEGDCSEGAGYQVFGFFYIIAAADMADRVLGTPYLKTPGFKNAWEQQLYYWAPGKTGDISFGDDMNGDGIFDNQETAFFMGPHLSRDKNAQAALTRRFLKKAKLPDPKRVFSYPWAMLAFYDPTVGEGDYKAVPTYKLFSDLGAASMRDSWEDDATCLTFKCGPYGGYVLNNYGHEKIDAEGHPRYIAIAHVDPDANEFALGMAGDFIFHPGLYSLKKITATHSSITIDGKGQINEGSDFTQPVVGDMRKLSYLTGWKVGEKGRIIIEGEAGNAYQSVRKEFEELEPNKKLTLDLAKGFDPLLNRFRRTTVWMPGEYILILDDVRGIGSHQITWRGTVEKGQFEKPADGKCYAYTKSGKQVPFQILANKEFTGTIDHMILDGRFANQLMQQFQFSANTEAVKFACLIDPWKKKPEMKLTESGDTVTLTVRSAAGVDTWTWQGAKDSTTPTPLVGKRGAATLISLTEKDKAPLGE